MLRTSVKSIVYTATAALMTALMAANAAAQTIIVDGVTYQAVQPTVAAPAQYAAPVPAPMTVTPVGYQTIQHAAPLELSTTYDTQFVQPNVNVIAPIVMTALGVWALSQWYKPAHTNGYRHGRNHRGVVVQAPVQPVWVPPAHGGHRHR